jgi:hypothetical protein
MAPTGHRRTMAVDVRGGLTLHPVDRDRGAHPQAARRSPVHCPDPFASAGPRVEGGTPPVVPRRHSSAVDQGVLRTGNPEHPMDDRQTSTPRLTPSVNPATSKSADHHRPDLVRPRRQGIQVYFIGGRNWTRSPSDGYGQPGSSNQSSSEAGLLLHCLLRNHGGPGPG